MSRYIERFLRKNTCFTDVKEFIHALSCCSDADCAALRGLRDWAARLLRDTYAPLLASDPPLPLAGGEGSIAASSAPMDEARARVVDEVVTKDTNDEGEADNDDEGEAEGDKNGEVKTAATANSKKNKKKKKKKSAAAAPTAETTVAGSTSAAVPEVKVPVIDPVAEREKEVLMLDLCAYSKLDQVAAYCDLLLGRAADRAHCVERSVIYDQTKGKFAGGMGGELRNVLPGDELLLLNSAADRLQFTAAVDAHAAEREKLRLAARWSAGLVHGMECSPYSFACKLDLLEPHRELAIGEAALVAYNGLGAKHVQVTCAVNRSM